MGTGFVWLRTGFYGGSCEYDNTRLGFNKCFGNGLKSERLLAARDEFCTVEPVIHYANEKQSTCHSPFLYFQIYIYIYIYISGPAHFTFQTEFYENSLSCMSQV